MNHVSLSIYLRAPRAVAMTVSVVLLCCALVLLVVGVLLPEGAAVTQAEDHLLAPFRWAPLSRSLA